jgi:hypothetical protein
MDTDTKKKRVSITSLTFKSCRKCGSKDLLKFEADTYCNACDWNSILMDVDCGNFEKRIAIVNWKKEAPADTSDHVAAELQSFEPAHEVGA